MKRQELAASKKPVIAISLVTAICLIGDSMLYIALPIYYKEVGLESLWEVGLILSLNRLIRIPLNPVVGWLYRRLPLKTGLLIAVFLSIITTIGYGTAHGLAAWIVLRVLWGVAWSFFRLGGFLTVIEYSTDGNRGKLLGTYNGLYRLGSLIGMLLGGILVSLFGISLISISFGLLMLIGIPLVYFIIPGKTTDEKEKENRQSTAWMNKPIFKAIITGSLIAFLTQGMFVSTLSLALADHYGDIVVLFGLTLGVTALAGFMQGLRWAWEPFLAMYIGHLSDRVGRLPLLIGFMIIGAGFLWLIPVSMPLLPWLFVVLGFMLVCTNLTTLVDAVTSDVASETDKNAVMTYYVVFLDIGAALGPFVSLSFISVKNGFEFIYGCGGLLLILLAFSWYKELRLKHST